MELSSGESHPYKTFLGNGENMEPGYVKLLNGHQLEQRVIIPMEHLTKCNLCPHVNILTWQDPQVQET